MVQTSNALSASVQALTLTKGLHLVSVTAATPQRAGDESEMMLPAIQVGPGPGAPPEQVEILSGPRNRGQWLFEAGDMLVVKVSPGPAVVLLTTLRTSASPPISVEVTRLDRRPAAPAPAFALPAPGSTDVAAAPPPPPLRTVAGEQALSVRLDLHLERKGDTAYVNTFWAGALGERLAIEAFAVTPLEGLRPDQIEYAAVNEAGGETGWTPGGQMCGVRGMATALTGFAIRPTGEAAMAYDCEYRGSFRSGRIVGPMRNGAVCRSDPGDRLEAIQLFILQRAPAEASPPALAAPPAPEEGRRKPRRKIGPRFSAFREPVE